MRPASGTWGTLAGAFLAYFVWLVSPNFFDSLLGALLVATLVVFASLVSTAALVVDPSGGDDPHWIVIDEIIGLFVTLLGNFHTSFDLIGAFFLFRLFDITKPFPARRAEDLPQGWGVVLDDVVAGVYANLTLNLVSWLVGLL